VAFLLVAALVFVVVMAIAVHVLMGMFANLMGMFMTIMGMSHGLVVMLVLMRIFVVAAHSVSPPLSRRWFYCRFFFIDVKMIGRGIFPDTVTISKKRVGGGRENGAFALLMAREGALGQSWFDV
jgi:hypothetical protein